jgi:nucleoside-diphosphate-sugar epimerase
VHNVLDIIYWSNLLARDSGAVGQPRYRPSVSAYIGDGHNRWPAAHVLDTARLYRLALEKGVARARYHAIGEEGVPLREIAEAIGRGLKLPVVSMRPEEVAEHFGFLGYFVAIDCPASSVQTQQQLGGVQLGRAP